MPERCGQRDARPDGATTTGDTAGRRWDTSDMTMGTKLRFVGGQEHNSAAKLRRLYLLQLVPLVGVLAFAGDGALAMRAFAHNNSYAVPVAVGVAALALVVGGGLYASYYAA